ncbi:hypothetical protein K2173_021211 [Erythroxylum novogranatense]|uniref:Uncharacterized protein n=1 Tax=Erythroxylum novogranatense TaxID=1862640 RepID=A0AAV8TP91_9ROSI|nr:hypothetical protein K2173_021211 [Erythroxylum novogranatense]
MEAFTTFSSSTSRVVYPFRGVLHFKKKFISSEEHIGIGLAFRGLRSHCPEKPSFFRHPLLGGESNFMSPNDFPWQWKICPPEPVVEVLLELGLAKSDLSTIFSKRHWMILSAVKLGGESNFMSPNDFPWQWKICPPSRRVESYLLRCLPRIEIPLWYLSQDGKLLQNLVNASVISNKKLKGESVNAKRKRFCQGLQWKIEGCGLTMRKGRPLPAIADDQYHYKNHIGTRETIT